MKSRFKRGMRWVGLGGACGVLLVAASVWAADAPSGDESSQPAEGLSAEVQFASDIQDRQPVDPSDELPAGKVYCWTLIKGGEGTFQVKHRWYHDDKLVWEHAITVRGKHWRTWTHLNVTPGQWKVEVVDASSDKVIGSGTFTVK